MHTSKGIHVVNMENSMEEAAIETSHTKINANKRIIYNTNTLEMPLAKNHLVDKEQENNSGSC